MTTDNFEHTFAGLMKNLNLDSTKFRDYDGNFGNMNYQQLAAVKTDIELQLATLIDMLTESFGADMSTSLLTDDGFPRNDIDVVSIRLVRVRIVRLKNDHKSVLQLIQDKLQELFANQEPLKVTETAPVDHQKLVPFAVVTEITENSPAAVAGLQLQDKIVVFDDIHAGNHDKLRAVAHRLKARQEQEVPVQVIRDENKLELQLVPSDSWSGAGLLGCRLVPL